MNSTFDPTSVLDTGYDDDLPTHTTPIPEGEWLGRIVKIDAKEITTKDGDKRIIAEFTFAVDDEKAQKATGMQQPQARYSVFLDTQPGTSQLVTKSESGSANVKLGKLKEAIGLKPGRKWSLRHMQEGTCWIKVRHRADRDDPEQLYAEVAAVSGAKRD